MLAEGKSGMKILYAALRHDPRDPDLASGTDYNFYSAIKRSGAEIKVIGPFLGGDIIFERALRKLYKKFTRKKYAKFSFSLTRLASKALNQADKAWKPDVIFTIFPPCLAFYRGKTPCVYRLDTSFLGWHQEYPEFGTFALKFLLWQERKAFKKCAKIITHSLWTKNILIKEYGVAEENIVLFPNPSAIPGKVVPRALSPTIDKRLCFPLKLLLVGRAYKRKGVDIGIEIARQLNSIGLATELIVCGLSKTEAPGKKIPFVKLVGPYTKSDPRQLQRYVALYQWAHFLLHPARFDPSPIVAAEAAAFGVPTITNDCGGLATTVKDGESGVVLPKASPAETYVEAILNFVRNPERYYELCRKARRRYERELNWGVAGKKAVAILEDAIKERQRK